MTDIEVTERIARAESDAKHALEVSQRNTELIMKNREMITEVDARARSAEHRVSKLEGKVDTILDKLSKIGNSQDSTALANEKIRKNTLKVFVTLIAAICVQVLNQLFA